MPKQADLGNGQSNCILANSVVGCGRSSLSTGVSAGFEEENVKEISRGKDDCGPRRMIKMKKDLDSMLRIEAAASWVTSSRLQFFATRAECQYNIRGGRVEQER